MSEPLVVIVRGALTEAVHRGCVAAVDGRSTLLGSVGKPAETVAYWRSASKPFQAIAVVASGAADRWGLDDQDLAIMAGSHGGEPVHVERVAQLLARIGSGAGELACGVHPPLDPETAAALVREGGEPDVLHNNCSGKHAGMLALARHLGTAVASDYRSPDHPVQRMMLTTVARFAGLQPEEIVLGLDGCGVPTFGTAVDRMALAFARLWDPHGIDDPYAEAADRIRTAMIAHPYLVAGRERLDTALMAIGRGRLVAKGGAGGVQCVGVAEGIGLAVKLEDGASGPSAGRPGSVATIEALHQLGALGSDQIESLRGHARPAIRTVSGVEVGESRPEFAVVFEPGRAGSRGEVPA